MTCHVEIIGQGKPLVMIHGWGMHSGVWQPLVERLSRNYMLYLVDLPGTGNSRPMDSPHLYNIANEVAEVMPGITDVLGWSLGGLVAQSIATSQPERVRRLVLVGSTPCFINKHDWPLAISADHFNDFAQTINADYKQAMMRFLTLQCMKAKDARQTIKQLRASLDLKPMPSQRALQDTLDILLETDLRDVASSINKPTLLLHGDRDTLAPVQAAHWMMRNMPKSFLRVISGAAHAPFLSHSDQFIESLDQFLEPDV
ncbi:MAG: pimeloyl-ACP methyl ester esterase BioH [Methylophilaceae bacterium]